MEEMKINIQGTLASYNPGIFIWKSDDLLFKSEKDKEGGICTQNIYNKDEDGGNDYQWIGGKKFVERNVS